MADVRNFKLPGVWAKNAYTTIPTPPVVNLAYRNQNLSQAEIEQGQLYGALGNSADWNQLLWLLSALLDESQKQGVLSWSPLIDYAIGSIVMGTDGNIYLALQITGPTTENTLNPVLEEESENPVWLNVTARLTASQATQYEICEFYNFRHPTARSGMVPRYGSLIQNAATLYPKAWAYLQTTDGQMLCKTEAEWQAMSTATYYTDASGTPEGWNGIGGVPFYVQDLGAGTLRVPDTRGMYSEDAGFDSLNVGSVKHDTMREMNGDILGTYGTYSYSSGVFEANTGISDPATNGGAYNIGRAYHFKNNRVVPVGVVNAPRHYGVLPCVYLGS